MAEGSLQHSRRREEVRLSAAGEMIYPTAVLKRIRRLCDVTPSTDTLDRGKYIGEGMI